MTENQSVLVQADDDLFDHIDDQNVINRMTVTKSNHLLSAGYHLTLNEMRLLMLVQGKVNPTTWDQTWVFRITAKEWSEAFGRSLRHSYRDIETAIDNIMDRKIQFVTGPDAINDPGSRKRVRHKGRWVSWAMYKDNEGAVEIEIPTPLRKYLAGELLASDGYTAPKLLSVGKLKSVYSVRFYEWMLQYYDKNTKTGIFLITVENLRQRLELGDKYTKYADLRKWVIDKAIAEIERHTHFKITYQPIKKKGRTITSLQFNYSEKPPC